MSDLKSAISYYNKAIEINPKNPDSYFNSGLCLAELNDLTKAKENFSKVIELKSDYAYAYYALGMAYETENNKDSAISNYEKFLEYKLGLLEDVSDKTTYTIEFSLTKEDDDWKLDSLTDTDIEKLHGIYSE